VGRKKEGRWVVKKIRRGVAKLGEGKSGEHVETTKWKQKRNVCFTDLVEARITGATRRGGPLRRTAVGNGLV